MAAAADAGYWSDLECGGRATLEHVFALTSMTRASISGIAPFFIVNDVPAALSFYRDMLAFEVTFSEPLDDPFFAIVQRDGAMIMLKSVDVDPLPNAKRDAEARWDA